MVLVRSSACSTAVSAFIPRAALAIMFGRTKVAKTSPSAGFAGPGCPMLALHFSASLRTASFPFSSPGRANGSFENQAL
jgi:hypothetical protein